MASTRRVPRPSMAPEKDRMPSVIELAMKAPAQNHGPRPRKPDAGVGAVSGVISRTLCRWTVSTRSRPTQRRIAQR